MVSTPLLEGLHRHHRLAQGFLLAHRPTGAIADRQAQHLQGNRQAFIQDLRWG
jgi:hypothetical protein